MSEEFIKTRREKSLPAYEDSSASRRDQAIATAEEVLSDDFNLLARLKDHDEVQMAVETIDPTQAVEAAPLTADQDPSKHGSVEPPAEENITVKRKSLLFNGFVQLFIVCIVMIWVFILGIMVGRGNLWQTALGGNLVSWLERKAGWNEPYLQAPIVEVKLKEADKSAENFNSAWNNNVTVEKVASLQLSSNLEMNDLPVAYQSQQSLANLNDAGTSIATGTHSRGAMIVPATKADDKPHRQLDVGTNRPSTRAEISAIQTALYVEAGGTAASPAEYGEYAVQVALAADEEEAKLRQQRLEAMGFKSYYYNNSRNRFPVRVGRFKNREEAKKAQDALIEKGYRNTYISKLTP